VVLVAIFFVPVFSVAALSYLFNAIVMVMLIVTVVFSISIIVFLVLVIAILTFMDVPNSVIVIGFICA
jgi:hypothetical protein